MDPVVVIGAGPYGLSAAAHLRGRGMGVRVVGDPLGTWRRNMPAGMILKSTPAASTISAPEPGHTLHDFCDDVADNGLDTKRQLVPIDTFIRYGEWFRKMLVPDVEQSRVVSVERQADVFSVRLDTDETIRARAVVVAAGLLSFAYLPPPIRSLASNGPSATGPVSHSSQHADLAGFAGREVVVVGAGQSALEDAALLYEAGASVRIVTRADAIQFNAPPTSGRYWRPDSPLGRTWPLYLFCNYASAFRYLPEKTRLRLVKQVLGPLGAWWLKSRVEGKIPVTAGQRLTWSEMDGDRPVLGVVSSNGDASRISADHVMAATGYRVDLSKLGFLSPDLQRALARTGGSPLLRPGFCSSVPGLYFTGLSAAATFGPVMRFVCGTWFASPRLAAHVAGHA